MLRAEAEKDNSQRHRSEAPPAARGMPRTRRGKAAKRRWSSEGERALHSLRKKKKRRHQSSLRYTRRQQQKKKWKMMMMKMKNTRRKMRRRKRRQLRVGRWWRKQERRRKRKEKFVSKRGLEWKRGEAAEAPCTDYCELSQP